MLVTDKSLQPWQLYMLSVGCASCAITVQITIYGVVNCNKLVFSCFKSSQSSYINHNWVVI